MAEPLRIIPLGGVGEIGKNMTVYDLDGEIIVVDAGLAFPRDEHLGVDLILPDISYLADRRDRVRAVILTHAHEDHVGALPYLLREVRVPEVWGTRLTLGLAQSRLDEHGLLQAAELKEAKPEGGPIDIGPFRLEFIRVAHSVPDSVAVLVETSAGRVLQTGDWKLDYTPVDGLHTDVGRLVGEAFRQIIPSCQGRVLVASFASNVHRMQQAIDVAVQTGRKVAVVGRSMRKNLNIARSLGYVDMPEEALIRPNELEEYRPHEVLVLCTGSQGEPMSALTRIAYDDHPSVSVDRGDTVIISAKPVPGNELRVHDSINQLARSGAEVLHQEIAPVH